MDKTSKLIYLVVTVLLFILISLFFSKDPETPKDLKYTQLTVPKASEQLILKLEDQLLKEIDLTIEMLTAQEDQQKVNTEVKLNMATQKTEEAINAMRTKLQDEDPNDNGDLKFYLEEAERIDEKLKTFQNRNTELNSIEINDILRLRDETYVSSTSNYLKDSEDYLVKLGVDKNLEVGKESNMVVVISNSVSEIELDSSMVQDKDLIPSDMGQFAKVKPSESNNFDFLPSSSDCFRIHSEGSKVNFTLIPKNSGTHDVKAQIQFYTKEGCEGTPTPRDSDPLEVYVTVDHEKNILEKLEQLFDIFWEKFLSFWGALIVFLFGTLLYLIRKKIKKKTGYSESEE